MAREPQAQSIPLRPLRPVDEAGLYEDWSRKRG
jgi:hypothetical protein